MDSYIEITWLHNFLICMHSGMVAHYLSWKPQSMKRIYFYSILVPLLACFCFSIYAWIWMFVLELSFCFWQYRYQKKTWLIMIANRLLWNFASYVFYDGTFHAGVYFVPCAVIPWVMWGILCFSWLLFYKKWKLGLAQLDFVYPIQIQTEKQQLQLKGYMDSGNFCSENGIPVMFLDDAYATCFTYDDKQICTMQTISDTRRMLCFKANVRIGNAPFKEVLIHPTSSLQLPLGCQALLNFQMMIQE